MVSVSALSVRIGIKDFRLLLYTAFVCSVGVFPACTKGDAPGGTGKKALLIILDGWGIGDKGKDDVISQTDTPYLEIGRAHV